ncbi:WhiB family redox-sensing transcriptional regulator [Murinocardiopsis flavida]|uniref:Transcriptional regulator WhiB n=1 Tax=Murinocardiopsis flavida TaxID=645275 RepID=A0A2P8DFZ2_9ACTN|nr:WhiB family transcriptional regulator [Murinocardiopsis flavida]PSK96126.1 WhiB family redox-sensing transcriptional regulator [Murinocardiopsis flavida]
MSTPDRRWHEAARCRGADPGLFFPAQGGSVRAAKRLCAACPVRRDCLAEALGSGEAYGVWGGTSEQDRRALRGAGAGTGGRR